MPTIVGIRRRGYTPEAIQLFCERIGVTKSDGWIDMSTLEGCLREDLDPKAPRAIAVLRPLKLIIDNFPENLSEDCTAPIHPHHPERGHRSFPITRELWIEQEDFMETPSKGYFRLFLGNKVRLRYGYVVECTGCDKDEHGVVIASIATTSPTANPAPKAAPTTRSRATSTGSAPRTRWKPRCGCTTVYLRTRNRTPAARISCRC